MNESEKIKDIEDAKRLMHEQLNKGLAAENIPLVNGHCSRSMAIAAYLQTISLASIAESLEKITNPPHEINIDVDPEKNSKIFKEVNNENRNS